MDWVSQEEQDAVARVEVARREAAQAAYWVAEFWRVVGDAHRGAEPIPKMEKLAKYALAYETACGVLAEAVGALEMMRKRKMRGPVSWR